MFDLKGVQAALREDGLDGWLLYDFRGLNVLARRIIDMPGEQMLSRRWFYFIPVQGEPRKLVHRIESAALDHVPGSKRVYLRWQELEAGVQALVQGARRVAMEYVPRNANPYVSRVDAGTIELVRSFGVEIVPSGDLIQRFEACWDDEQWTLHLEAAVHTRSAYDVAFGFIADQVRRKIPVRETDVQKVILAHFEKNGVMADHAPIVAVGPHSGDPHYAPEAGKDALIQGDFVLIDLWAKCKKPRAVYSDLTRTAFVGKEVPAVYKEIFAIVAAARDAAIAKVRSAFAAGQVLRGWEVDLACRGVIEKAGKGEFFCHRTGHSIGQEVHGNGANMDGLETREERRVLPRTLLFGGAGHLLARVRRPQRGQRIRGRRAPSTSPAAIRRPLCPHFCSRVRQNAGFRAEGPHSHECGYGQFRDSLQGETSMATVRISGHWRTVNKLEWAGTPEVDAEGHIERTIKIPEEAFEAIEGHLARGVKEGSLYLQDGRRFDWLLDGPLPVKPVKAAAKAALAPSKFFAVDAGQMPWEERFNEKTGKAFFRKELFSEPETGMLVRLVRYPAGIINPSHTHRCGHGMYVLEGQLVTHKGTFGPGSFVWFPEGEVMEDGASAAGDVTVVFITNKPFRTDDV